MTGNREEYPHPSYLDEFNHPLGHNFLRHINIESLKVTGMDQLYIEIDAAYCDMNGKLERFEIYNIQPKTTHKDLTKRFEVNYLVLYDRNQRQYFFIKNADCQLNSVSSDMTSNSTDPIMCRATYYISFSKSGHLDLPHGYYWDPIRQLAVPERVTWFDTGIRAGGLGMGFGNHDHEESVNLDNASLRLRSRHQEEERPHPTNWLDQIDTIQTMGLKWTQELGDIKMQEENPHPDLLFSRSEFLSGYFAKHEWTTIQPIGKNEPILYKHLPTGTIATIHDLDLKAKRIIRKRKKISQRNLNTLQEYLTLKKYKKK